MSGIRARHTVVARRWAKGWELHIDGVGVTQSHTLADADLMARDYVSRLLEVPADSFDLEIRAEVGRRLLNVAETWELAERERPHGRLSRLRDAIRGGGS